MSVVFSNWYLVPPDPSADPPVEGRWEKREIWTIQDRRPRPAERLSAHFLPESETWVHGPRSDSPLCCALLQSPGHTWAIVYKSRKKMRCVLLEASSKQEAEIFAWAQAEEHETVSGMFHCPLVK